MNKTITIEVLLSKLKDKFKDLELSRRHQENQVRNQKHIKNKFLILIKIGVLNLQRCKIILFKKNN